MTAVDPTYPAFPVVSTLAAVLLLLVLMSAFVRQSWNLGVTFLCGWFLLENLTNIVNTIAWSDNADIKLYFWCDMCGYSVLSSLCVPY